MTSSDVVTPARLGGEMSKRDRKVAFAEKVEVAEKKQREEEGEDNRTAEDNGTFSRMYR